MRIYVTAIGILAVVYAIQVITPPRLHPDTVVLLSVGEFRSSRGWFR